MNKYISSVFLFLTIVLGVNGAAFCKDSPLASGTWYKVKVVKSGIYKITGSDLQSMGFDIQSVDSKKIRVHGSGGKVLDETVGKFRYDDVVENAIYVNDGGDGRFDLGDYLLFYGHGVEYSFYDDEGELKHIVNPYSDAGYYFVTIGDYDGKRLQLGEVITEPSIAEVRQFEDIYFHEKDLVSVGTMGREWLGEIFDTNIEQTFDVSLPNIDLSKNVKLSSRVAARGTNSSSFSVSVDGANVLSQTLSTSSGNSYTLYVASESSSKFRVNGPNLKLKYKYNRKSSGDKGWLGWFELLYSRNMTLNGGVLNFKLPTDGDNSVSTYVVGGANSAMQVWDISDYANPILMQGSLNGGNYTFKSRHDKMLKEYYAFDGSQVLKPENVGTISNQNLHGLPAVDYIIVTHSNFINEANRLADYHRSFSGLDVVVATLGEIYNEFSSGAQDITAIRDFAKLMYDKGKLKYMLLFGDCSYDYKDRIANNTNYVPTFESTRSEYSSSTIQTDDYFAMLDDGEGGDLSTGTCTSYVDIAVGRFPVTNIEQATNAVDKTINYMTNSESTMGAWRNIVGLVADDGEDNDKDAAFMLNCEKIDNLLKLIAPNINTDKMYLDNYEQIATPGSHRYPDANAAINRRANDGALIMNYVGHAGPLGWSKEQVLTTPDVLSWKNWNNIPIIMTASCEFTRCDDPGRVSTGEASFLNPNGGAFLISATRATFDYQNMSLMLNIYQNVFSPDSDGRIGYAYKNAKSATAQKDSFHSENTLKYLMICDPALKIAIPKYDIKVVEVNGKRVDNNSVLDSIKAFSHVKIKCEVQNKQGVRMNEFNGRATSTVYDKEKITHNRGNDEGIKIIEFPIRNSIIFKGDVVVTSGEFEFEFITPKDIDYSYGNGKISLYASDGREDASGNFEDIVVGGIDTSADMDATPPNVIMGMNSIGGFYSGMKVNDRPIFVASITDESGINTVGNGIGHDMVLKVVGEDYSNRFIINNYYKAAFGTYKQGDVKFELPQLADGKYTLSFIVWDVFNNSTISELEFEVCNSSKLIIDNLFNYPNPFSTITYIAFEHNQPSVDMKGELFIYDMAGRLVKTIKKDINSAGFFSDDIIWDRSTDGGGYADIGIYIYVLNVYGNNNTLQSSLKGKMMIK